MPQPYLRPTAELQINRGVYGGFRDDNFNLGWSTIGPNTTFSTDGDIGTLTVTANTGGVQKTVPGSLSSTSFPNATARLKVTSTTTLTIFVVYTDLSSDSTTHTGVDPGYVTLSIALTAGKTISNVQFMFNTVATQTALVDYILISKKTPITLLKQDFDPIQVTRATSSVDEFSFNLRNTNGLYTTGSKAITLYDDLYIYLGYIQDDTQTKKLVRIFGGSIEELSPTLSTGGDILRVHGRGWAVSLLLTLIAKDYGSLSDNSAITKASDAIKDIIDIANGSGIPAGGYQLTKTYIQTFTPTMTYIMLKNDPSFNAVKQLTDLITANNDPTGTTTSPVEFWVDPAENVHMAPLGAWGTDPNPSTYANALNVGRDQITNDFRKDIEHMRNQVHYFAATAKPPNRDAWTETGPITDWTVAATGGTGGTFIVSYDTVAFKVNSKSVKGNWTGMTSGTTGIDLTYVPATALALDVTKLGGKISPPKLKMFLKTDAVSTSFPYAIQIHMMTDATNYFQSNYWPTNVLITTNQGGITSSDWQIFEMAVGPYGDFPPGFQTGSPSWTNINRIKVKFLFGNAYAAGNVWVDGFFLSGQTHYVAKDSTRVNSYGLRETHLVNNKVRETATQQLLAKTELYRLHNPILRGSIRVPGIPDLLPGQKVTITAPSANLSAASLRVLEVRHSFGAQEGFVTEIDLTDDLTSYLVLEPTRLSNMLLEVHTSPFKRREEQDVYMGEPDPTTTATMVDYPS